MEIIYYNAVSGKEEREEVYGERAVEFLYQNSWGNKLSEVLAFPLVSRLYGVFQDQFQSQKKIEPFVKKFNINLDDFIPEEGRTKEDPYSTFNEFFIRRFAPGRRPFEEDSRLMPAPCEARYFAYDNIDESVSIPVKGHHIRPKDLVAKEKWAGTFENGPLYIARLCPVDYHRFHFPDSGKVLDSWKAGTKLHSVNPIALKEKPGLFVENERVVTILETENFGKLAYIEVGAICVGKIVQSYLGDRFKRGDEKGYFLFGGSTVIVIGEEDKWSPSHDIIERSKKGVETYQHIGRVIGEASI